MDPKDLKIKALGIILYHYGLSLRKIAILLGISHETIRKYYQRVSWLFHVSKKHRRAIAIDETVVKLNKLRVYVWIAIDVDSKKN